MMRNNVLLICLAVSLAFACKKDASAPDEQIDPSGSVNVLKDNSGFTQVYNATGIDINLSDFSVEANDNLNIVHYTTTKTKQDDLLGYVRETKNLKTNEIIPLPQYAFDVKNYSPIAIAGYEKITKVVSEGFKPYSNFFTYGTYRNGNTTFNYQVTLGGDYSAEVKSGNPLGYPTLGYYYPSLDVAVGQSYYGGGVPTASYLYRVINFYPGIFNNGTSKTLVQSVLETRYAFNNNGSAMRFDVNTNSVMAYETNPSDANYAKKTGEISFNTPLTSAKIIRHYSADGKKLVLLIQETVENKYWAVAYDFSTSTLTKLFDKTALDYGGAGSDVDCDEDGNLYYTGYAGNGKNAIGVSIYKKDKSGITTLIGLDNFLKFGEVVSLKSLYGKVYFALKGKITGSTNSQLSIVKQN
ncbi:MAG: hypothetical protein ABIP95_07860 [Pelobium sp.]